MIHAGSVLDELIRPPDADDGNLDAPFAEEFQDRAAVSTRKDVVFQGDDDFRDPAESSGQLRVNRLGEARVDDGAIETFGGELGSSLPGDALHVAQRKEGHLV